MINTKEQIKKKNNMMKSIMSNPKLARAFRDAVSAPIGSTKRDQAKAVLSIMKKVGGIQNDGQGGPLGNSFVQGFSSAPAAPAPTTGFKMPDFGNMFVFPSAPAFKMPTVTAPTPAPAPKTTPITKTNPFENKPNFTYSWNGGPESTSPYDATHVPAKPPVPKATAADIQAAKDQEGYKPGLVPRALGALGGGLLKGLNWTKNVLGTVGWGAEGVAESTVRNIVPAARALFTGETAANPIRWTGIQDTLGGRVISKTFAGKPTDKTNIEETTSSIVAKPVDTTEPTDTTQKTNVWETPYTSKDNTQTDTEVTPPGYTAPTQFKWNIAATSISKILGTNPDAKLSTISIPDLAKAIATNEGYFNGTSKPAIRNNNPGNLKFAHQPGATADAKGYAVFATPEAGGQALINDLTAKYNSGEFATINDLMIIYSPDLDNPANPNYSSNGSSPTGSYSSVADAVKNNIGASTYALGAADQLFPEGLPAHLANDKKKLELEYNIKAKEEALTELTSKSVNFLPTLKQYMSGKDQYLKYVDKLIEAHDKSAMNADLSNPVIAADFKAQSDFLYGLKGKQEQRYSNYLSAASADYQADVQRLTDDYTRTFNDYKNAVTEGANLDQTTYNDILTRASALYTDLEQADARTLNQRTIYDQNLKTSLGMIEAGIDQSTIDPDYFENKAEYIKAYGDKDGGLSDAAVSAGGIETMVREVADLQGRPASTLIFSLQQLIQKRITNASGKDATETPQAAIAKINKYLSDFAVVAPVPAATLKQALYKAGSGYASSYMEQNLTQVKAAAEDLVKGQTPWYWFNKESGLADKEGWMARHADVDKEVLESLYTNAQKAITPESSYAKNPQTYIDKLFRGADTKQQASSAAAVLL